MPQLKQFLKSALTLMKIIKLKPKYTEMTENFPSILHQRIQKEKEKLNETF